MVSGRRTEEVAGLVRVPGVRYEGLYGMESGVSDVLHPLRPSVETAARVVPEAWVEDRGAALAIHYRQAPDPALAREALIGAVRALAADAGLELLEGKMVLDLVPAGRPRKGGAVERLVESAGLLGALFAGDDAADLDAFSTLDRLAAGGFLSVKVAVRGEETPPALLDAADLVVEGPDGLVDLLGQLA